MRFLCLLLAVPLLLGQGATPDGMARLNAFVEAFNSKNDAKIQAMMDANFAPSMYERRKPADWIAHTKDVAADLAPLAVKETLLEKDTVIAVAVITKNGERLGLRIDFAKEAPYLITGISISSNVQGLVEDRPKLDIQGFKNLKDLAQQVREGEQLPAIGIAIWKDGKLDTAVDGIREVGKPDPVTTKDRWLIGSIGKSMTATILGRLIDEGKLKWDSKLGDLLKDVPMRPEYRDVQIEQIMQHRGGIPQDLNYTADTIHRIVGDLKDPTQIRAAYVKDILSREPIAKPGEKFAYSNAGYAILGHIAERIAGKPFEKLLEEYVFKPIGMDSAIAGMPGRDGQPSGKGEPHGHIPTAKGFVPHVLDGPLTYMAAPAGAGVSCTVADLAKYAAWHMRGYLGEPIQLKPETIRRLHTPLVDKPGAVRYADGWLIESGLTPTEFQAHNGSDGTFRADIAFWPKEKMAGAAIVNCGGEGDPAPGLQAILAVYRKYFGK